MRLHAAMKNGERTVVPFRTATLSTQIVAHVRDALFARELRSGDFLGTEKDLAERFGVSRIVARDALRTLEAQGIVEIKVGAGGGARIARGNTRVFAEALAVHRELSRLIAMRDAAGARQLMDGHVKMIRARRVAEHVQDATDHCC